MKEINILNFISTELHSRTELLYNFEKIISVVSNNSFFFSFFDNSIVGGGGI